MSQYTIMPPLEIERITALLEAASWCKSPEMEQVLAQTIKRFLNPPAIYVVPTDEVTK
jgi:hypothetical protein